MQLSNILRAAVFTLAAVPSGADIIDCVIGLTYKGNWVTGQLVKTSPFKDPPDVFRFTAGYHLIQAYVNTVCGWKEYPLWSPINSELYRSVRDDCGSHLADTATIVPEAVQSLQCSWEMDTFSALRANKHYTTPSGCTWVYNSLRPPRRLKLQPSPLLLIRALRFVRPTHQEKMLISRLIAILVTISLASAAYTGPCEESNCGASGQNCTSGYLCVPYPHMDQELREGCTCSIA
ncbi:uncharacterized protein PgNI_05055 [Pyricularia grisea]|uniref:Uncharacterized protein n=1 Tax=Pyricularia grisea TaxID=148305 RepID=A0A6P8BB16_PYRGI|nr:uncharacterized protein PgNI_05055 [Pyricularia grisea]TLD13020.1 hypothetical protein PgNI_05055 [Pyricularia grisea]